MARRASAAGAPAVACGATIIGTKLCSACDARHELSAFLPTKFSPDGLTSICLPAIKQNAERDRQARERRHAQALARAAAEPIKLRCRACGAEKLTIQFSPHRLSKTGFRKDCRSCVRADRVRRKELTAEQKQRDRERRAQPYRRIANRVAVAAWRQSNPGAVAAKMALRRAVRKGMIEKPAACEAKGCKRTDILGHHDSYAQPRKATWVCPAHHRKIHAGVRVKLKSTASRRYAAAPSEGSN
jgi:hypothetical protein